MNRPWAKAWEVEERVAKGSQSVTHLVFRRIDGRLGFLKEVRAPKQAKARGRFRREVIAYETLASSQIPALIEHNADAWEELNTPLYAVLERIQGVDLTDFISGDGPLVPEKAFALVRALAEVLRACHDEGVIHRDVKPANVMLRGSRPEDPVLVDFGLSFSRADANEGDLTEVGEEVGNRFLRLPEQPFSNRSAVSDVTQLCGILLFVLTGEEPRVLLDASNKMPHQREPAATLLRNTFDEHQFRQLMSLFDQGFVVSASSRFQSAQEFLSAIRVVEGSEPSGKTLEAMLGEMQHRLEQPLAVSRIDVGRRLGQFALVIRSSIQHLAKGKGIDVIQSGARTEIGEGGVPFTETRMGIGLGRDAQLVHYRVELHGDDVVLLINGNPGWRGTDHSDPQFHDAIVQAAVESFLAHS